MSWLRTLPLAAALLGLACQNNTIELDFADGDDGGGSSTGNDPTGTDGGSDPATSNADVADTGVDPGPATLLMAIDTTIAPGLPFQAIVTTVPGDGTIDLTLQFLSLNQGSTTSPRQPVGDIYGYPGVPVDDTGAFVWSAGVVLIPGAANPISGADTVVSLTIAARPEGSPYCGEAGGSVLTPFEAPIDGSTHAMTQVSDVNNLPVDFPVSCF
jgi:hypothetical protein